MPKVSSTPVICTCASSDFVPGKYSTKPDLCSCAVHFKSNAVAGQRLISDAGYVNGSASNDFKCTDYCMLGPSNILKPNSLHSDYGAFPHNNEHLFYVFHLKKITEAARSVVQGQS